MKVKVLTNEAKFEQREGWHISPLPLVPIDVLNGLPMDVCFELKDGRTISAEYIDVVSERVLDIPNWIIFESHGIYQVEFINKMIGRFKGKIDGGMKLAVWRWRLKDI